MNGKFFLLFLFDTFFFRRLRNFFRFFYPFRKNSPKARESIAYGAYLWTNIHYSINHQLSLFSKKRKLPQNFGIGLPERVIEYPWAIANIPDTKGLHLDAGSTLNFSDILEHKKLSNKDISIVNLNPEWYCYWYKSISYVYGDLRKLMFKDNYFDSITLLSVLEHVGLDNEVYSKNYKENKAKDYLLAVDELKRVLKPNGVILVSVPYGQYQNFKWFQNFNAKMVTSIIKRFNPSAYDLSYYKYGPDGWQISDKAACDQSLYPKTYPNKDLCSGARAVALLKMVK